ncbi:hypothetical protein KUTeg_005404, partial [Tegillarca granosa]
MEHLPVDLFFIHHTSEQSCTDPAHCIKIVQGIQNYHIEHNGWWDIGYSFLVGEDGNVYEGRGWKRVGAHTYGFNSRSLALSFIGNFENRVPNEKALNAAKALLECGIQKGYLNPSYRLYGHRDALPNECPGTSLYNLINTWPHYSTIPLQKSSDLLCINRGGTCQDDSISCPGGYVSNHCSGAANRRCCLPSTSNTGSCNNVKIISRDSWGARDPKTISQEHLPVDLFFIHHTEGPSCTDTATCINWSDIGYSFLVGEDGNVYEGRGWHRVGAHTQGYNSRSLAVSVMGNYMNHLPNEKALAAVKALIQCGVDNGYISHHYRLYGHRDAGSTNCPGTTLYNLIRTWPHY